DRTKLDAQQLLAYSKDLQQLPALPLMADAVDLFERFMVLDIVMIVNRHGLQYLDGVVGGVDGKMSDPAYKKFEEAINWDPALRNANKWFDRLAGAMRAKDRAAKVKQLDALMLEAKALNNQRTAQGALAKAFTGAGATPE